MSIFTNKELRERAFNRAALMLYSFWEEQKENMPRTVSVHSRIFDTLIYDDYIVLNKKAPNRKYPEHVVPCAYIRNLAFDMYWNEKSIDDVAGMIGRLLHIAYINSEEAVKIDKKLNYPPLKIQKYLYYSPFTQNTSHNHNLSLWFNNFYPKIGIWS